MRLNIYYSQYNSHAIETKRSSPNILSFIKPFIALSVIFRHKPFRRQLVLHRQLGPRPGLYSLWA